MGLPRDSRDESVSLLYEQEYVRDFRSAFRAEERGSLDPTVDYWFAQSLQSIEISVRLTRICSRVIHFIRLYPFLALRRVQSHCFTPKLAQPHKRFPQPLH